MCIDGWKQRIDYASNLSTPASKVQQRALWARQPLRLKPQQQTYLRNGQFVFPQIQAARKPNFQLLFVRVRVQAALGLIKLFCPVRLILASNTRRGAVWHRDFAPMLL